MRGDIRIWVARRTSILGLLVKSSSPEVSLNGKLIHISSRFHREAMFTTSYRFLCEATGRLQIGWMCRAIE